MKVLIFTCYKNLERFQSRVDNRTLLWGLDQANIDWELSIPWQPLPELAQFDGAFSTLYAPLFRNFIYYCKTAEQKCLEAGVPVINSCANYSPPHSFFLKQWKEAGIPCARYEFFRDFDTVSLKYPMILRVDGVHRGLNMYFVSNKEEAMQAINYQNELHVRYFPSREGPKPLNIAIEFVDTVCKDGFYEKKRCYVIGDKIIAAHCLRSRTRFVNYKDSLLDPATCAVDREYTLHEEFTDDYDLVMRAAKATGIDIITLDYSIRQDGEYIFWEGNRRRATAGDQRIKWLGIRPPDLVYGNTVADFIQQKIAVASIEA